eukprot:CAMPEP_0173180008 /NCGR_PEP_ID=MMETSP1141-20130122/6460_1 /TAXON_ID=483371 /ORGANISM="non described non described, Strain CCMP2298" /LENGTH=128 /DNA_ID=CAMNT_0014102777 /DNA_START=1 /DNA_END=384 /DNA_ORIENTATION=-
MPVMNGPTATKQLREMGCDSYIVGVTGNVMQADVDVFMDAGANAVLAKPLRIEIFESMMASLSSSTITSLDGRGVDTLPSGRTNNNSSASTKSARVSPSPPTHTPRTPRGVRVGAEPDSGDSGDSGDS